jgi:hypothetical protein
VIINHQNYAFALLVSIKDERCDQNFEKRFCPFSFYQRWIKILKKRPESSLLGVPMASLFRFLVTFTLYSLFAYYYNGDFLSGPNLQSVHT